MSTINEVVDQTLQANGRGEYAQYAAPVVTALVNREQEIVGTLIEFAQNSDLDVEGVRSALAQAGLHMPVAAQQEDVAAATVGESLDAGIASALARIEQVLTGLTTFARANGYRG